MNGHKRYTVYKIYENFNGEDELCSVEVVDTGANTLSAKHSGLAFGCKTRIPRGLHATTPESAWALHAKNMMQSADWHRRKAEDCERKAAAAHTMSQQKATV